MATKVLFSLGVRYGTGPTLVYVGVGLNDGVYVSGEGVVVLHPLFSLQVA